MELLDRLRSMIHAGVFPDGRLPTEPEIAGELKVSRGTLRRALAQLEHEGVFRKHGSGTYISRVLRITTAWMKCGIFEMIHLSGYERGPHVRPAVTSLLASS
jgi:DNA-binding GntR family transcriptional regulator